MSRSPRLSRAQLWALAAVPAALGALAGYAGVRAALAVVLGPFSGGVLRGWQSCCASFSLAILPWSLASVALGAGVQFAVAPTSTWRNVVRWTGWMVALLAWFGGAILSDLHALE